MAIMARFLNFAFKKKFCLFECQILNLNMLCKISADDILKYFEIFSYFSQKRRFDISCKLSHKETICMKCQLYFSGKNKKKISLSSTEYLLMAC